MGYQLLMHLPPFKPTLQQIKEIGSKKLGEKTNHHCQRKGEKLYHISCKFVLNKTEKYSIIKWENFALVQLTNKKKT